MYARQRQVPDVRIECPQTARVAIETALVSVLVQILRSGLPKRALLTSTVNELLA
jgi:hypothetical protein